jgi:hypothetical protein
LNGRFPLEADICAFMNAAEFDQFPARRWHLQIFDNLGLAGALHDHGQSAPEVPHSEL